MAQDNETMAVQASGVGLFHIILPSIVWSVIVAVGMALFNNYILPETNHAFAQLMVEINRARPTARIQEGIFIKDFPGHTLFISRLDDRSGRMEQVLIFDTTDGLEQARTIMANEGHLTYKPGVLELELENGVVHEPVPEGGGTTYRRLRFQKQTLFIKEPEDRSRQPVSRSRGQRELSIAGMKGRIEGFLEERGRYEKDRNEALDSLGIRSIRQLPGPPVDPPPALAKWIPWLRSARPDTVLPDSVIGPKERRYVEEARMKHFQIRATDKRIAQYKVEIHKKLSIPAACIVFVLLGAPLGIKARRGGAAAGFISVGFFLLYYLFLVGGEELADRGIMAPWFSMWLPNIVLGVAGLWLVLTVCNVRLKRRETT
jgi:lipopolysaccharide export system permease protein